MATKKTWRYQFDYNVFITFYKADDDNAIRFDVDEINPALGYVENGLNVILTFTGAKAFKNYHYHEIIGKKTKHFLLENALELLQTFDPDNTEVQKFINWIKKIKKDNTILKG